MPQGSNIVIGIEVFVAVFVIEKYAVSPGDLDRGPVKKPVCRAQEALATRDVVDIVGSQAGRVVRIEAVRHITTEACRDSFILLTHVRSYL